MTPPDPRRPREDPPPRSDPPAEHDEGWGEDADYGPPANDDDLGLPLREGGNLAGDSDEEL